MRIVSSIVYFQKLLPFVGKKAALVVLLQANKQMETDFFFLLPSVRKRLTVS